MTKSNINALYLEDDVQDIELAQAAAEDVYHKHDFHFTVLNSGDLAVQYIDRLTAAPETPVPDLVILDLNLPRIKGLDILRRMKDCGRMGSIPIVVLTGSSSPVDRTESEKFGVRLFLEKSSSYSAYKEMFKRICGLLPHD